jgi:hypothetical protein
VFNHQLTVHAAGEVINPTIIGVRKLARDQPGVERFLVECSCGEGTVVHVRVEQALAASAGSFTCGCGYKHWFNVGPALLEERP